MYSTKSYKLTKDEYNYLLPTLRGEVGYMGGDDYHLVANSDELEDAINRLKGLYDYYDYISTTVVYQCQKNGSLKPFRDFIG